MDNADSLFFQSLTDFWEIRYPISSFLYEEIAANFGAGHRLWLVLVDLFPIRLLLFGSRPQHSVSNV